MVWLELATLTLPPLATQGNVEMATTLTSLKQQRGSAMLEALIAVLIFSMGIIALMGLQAASIKNSIDAKYRADAAYFTNQIISRMWVDRTNIDSYAHNSGGTTACAPTGAASTNTNVVAWLNTFTTATSDAYLPGATSAIQQIFVTTLFGNTKQVKVTVCWKGPRETYYHNFVATAQIIMP